jgi:hypothetical protein
LNALSYTKFSFAVIHPDIGIEQVAREHISIVLLGMSGFLQHLI